MRQGDAHSGISAGVKCGGLRRRAASRRRYAAASCKSPCRRWRRPKRLRPLDDLAAEAKKAT